MVTTLLHALTHACDWSHIDPHARRSGLNHNLPRRRELLWRFFILALGSDVILNPSVDPLWNTTTITTTTATTTTEFFIFSSVLSSILPLIFNFDKFCCFPC